MFKLKQENFSNLSGCIHSVEICIPKQAQLFSSQLLLTLILQSETGIFYKSILHSKSIILFMARLHQIPYGEPYEAKAIEST